MSEIQSVRAGMPPAKKVEEKRSWSITVSDGTTPMTLRGLDVAFRFRSEIKDRNVEMISIMGSSPGAVVLDADGEEVTPLRVRDGLGLMRFMENPSLEASYVIDFGDGGAHICRKAWLFGIKTGRGKTGSITVLEWEIDHRNEKSVR